MLHAVGGADPERGSEMTVLSPGWLSSSLSSPPCRRATGCAIFDRVIDQIGERLADELPVAVNRRSRRRLDLEVDALFIGERLVELAHPARDLGRIKLGHAVARLARLRARDHEQRIE